MFKNLILILLAFSLVSCATIFKGNNDIAVSSTKGPLKVKVSDNSGYEEVFKTPFTFKPNRFRHITFTVVEEGYESEKYSVDKKIRVGMFIIDLLFTPFAAGLLIDFSTGKIYEHENKHLIIHNGDLVKKKAEAIQNGADEFKAKLSFSFVGEDADKEEARIDAHKELLFKRI